ncbi:MAG: transglutaminase domain-containing protein [Armatimonadetes bacterium]|nr:transglutaminase domain-containing protein [Armatimonadota bacterium]
MVRQRYVTKGYAPPGIPGLGRIVQVNYPRSMLTLSTTGTVVGNAHGSPEQLFDVFSEVVEHDPQELREAPRVNTRTFIETETLSLPQSTFRVDDLARRITSNLGNDYDRVQAIIAYIEKTCTYTLQEEPTPAGEDAAAYYLFQTKRGACDLAATAAAIMCRAVGIPARVAIGYVAEEPLPGSRGFLIRQEHAHMWFEAYFPGFGWVPFNPAPVTSSIADHPMQILWYRIERLLRKIGGGGLDALMLVLVVLVTLGLIGYRVGAVVRRWYRGWSRARRAARGAPEEAIPALYVQGLRRLERQGWRREAWMTPQEFVESLRGPWSDHLEAFQALEQLSGAFERAYYGQDDSTEALLQASRAVAVLRRVAPRMPKPRRTVLRRKPVPA